MKDLQLKIKNFIISNISNMYGDNPKYINLNKYDNKIINLKLNFTVVNNLYAYAVCTIIV